MKAGIQFRNLNDISAVKAAGFQFLEFTCDDGKTAKDDFDGRKGLSADSFELDETKLLYALKKAADIHGDYLVLTTKEEISSRRLMDLLSKAVPQIKDSGVPVLIENAGSYNGFSEGAELKAFTEALNRKALKECFGICLNTGYMNLLGKNPGEMIQELKDCIQLIHINDNDGISDLHQMPCTFTTGRGILSTNWYRIIGSLAKARYSGRLVFDTWGLFEQAPRELHAGMLKLLSALAREWESQIAFEKILEQDRKQIILFGAGNMFCNYMKAWGGKYPPAFVIDNNASLWGEKRMGIPVKGPEDLLKIPEKQRNVLICNMYYRQTQKQLEHMGVRAVPYLERYFL